MFPITTCCSRTGDTERSTSDPLMDVLQINNSGADTWAAPIPVGEYRVRKR